jgi:hypothetical protein
MVFEVRPDWRQRRSGWRWSVTLTTPSSPSSAARSPARAGQ